MSIIPEKYFKELDQEEQDKLLLDWSITLNNLINSQIEYLNTLQTKPYKFYEHKIAEFNRNITSHNKLIYRRIRELKKS